MLFTAAFGMTAYADKAIKTVGIKVTGTVNAGSPIGDEKLEIKPQGSRYTVNHYEVLNEGPSWKETDVPDIKIHLQAEDGYYFRVNAASQVHIDGAEYVTATREDNAYALIVEVKLPSLALQASSINEANLTNTTASWTESLGAGSYETKWKRDGKTIGVVRTVQGTSHDVSAFFTKAGVYSFQVRGVSAQNPDFRGPWTESNDIVVTEEMASAQRAKNAAAESAGTWEANGDKWTQSANAYVCNGPFKISEINPGASIVLTKNENYWDAANVSLEKLNFRYILDTSTALTAYENGEVDGIRSIPAGDIARLKAENAGVVVTPNYGTVYYNINCGKEPYNNPKVRKALALAIDRNALINNVAQLDATPAYSWMAPGYVIDGKDITEGRSDFDLKPTADPEAAKAALAEAGYANPAAFPTIHLSYYSDDNAKKVAEAMAEMLTGNLGVKVEVSSADWAVFYDAVQNGDYEVAAMGWSADYVNPMSFLPLLYTDDVANSLFYSNSNYDALVDRIRSERDSAKFAELVKQADETVSVEYPVLPLYYKSNTYLMHNYVSGVYMTSNGNLYFKKAVVSK